MEEIEENFALDAIATPPLYFVANDVLNARPYSQQLTLHQGTPRQSQVSDGGLQVSWRWFHGTWGAKKHTIVLVGLPDGSKMTAKSIGMTVQKLCNESSP